MRRSLTACALALVFCSPVLAQQPGDVRRWDAWRFLIGDWSGEGSGNPGEGWGGFSLKPDLQGNILVRRNWSDHPATKDQPAIRHEDLMVVYPESVSGKSRAVYFDNEGHVIYYSASFSDDGKTLTFLSDAASSAPVFRLTYVATKPDEVQIKFEIAPPGKPNDFKVYVVGLAHRTAH